MSNIRELPLDNANDDGPLVGFEIDVTLKGVGRRGHGARAKAVDAMNIIENALKDSALARVGEVSFSIEEEPVQYPKTPPFPVRLWDFRRTVWEQAYIDANCKAEIEPLLHKFLEHANKKKIEVTPFTFHRFCISVDSEGKVKGMGGAKK